MAQTGITPWEEAVKPGTDLGGLTLTGPSQTNWFWTMGGKEKRGDISCRSKARTPAKEASTVTGGVGGLKSFKGEGGTQHLIQP